jgi:transcription elongation factor GreA
MVGEQVRKYPMTPEGHAKLQATVRDLLEVQRPAAVKAIEVARAHGDLSENSEYDDAKERQGMIEARIRDYEAKLGLAEVIDPSMLSGNKVMFGAHVTVEDVDSDEILTYQLVGSEETDLKRGHISIESPIGRALLGREVDDEVNFNVPRGRRTVVVTEVEYK